MTISTDDKRKALADRLNECMELNGKTQADLIRHTKEDYGVLIKSGYLSMILQGKRTLPEDYAEYFSNILGVEYGYLIGSDKFVAKSYEDFRTITGTIETVMEQLHLEMEEKRKKYDTFLVPCGYKTEAFFAPDGTPVEYKIKYKSTSTRWKYVTISAQEMEQFRKDVENYIHGQVSLMINRHKK